MGLPIAGVVIARRQINPEQPKELGTVHLTIYVKFSKLESTLLMTYL